MSNLQSRYPPQLESVRQGILATLTLEAGERQKLESCRLKSHCHSCFCPLCLKMAGDRQKWKLFQSASQIPASRLKFATFKSADVPLDALRTAGKAIMKAGRSTMKTLKIPDHALRLETSCAEWTDNFHPHLHGILNSAPGGRNYVSPDGWENAWMAELPSWLQPAQGTHIETVRNLQAASSYLTKSLFAECAESTAEIVARIIDGIQATKGITKYSVRGAFAA